MGMTQLGQVNLQRSLPWTIGAEVGALEDNSAIPDLIDETKATYELLCSRSIAHWGPIYLFDILSGLHP